MIQKSACPRQAARDECRGDLQILIRVFFRSTPYCLIISSTLSWVYGRSPSSFKRLIIVSFSLAGKIGRISCSTKGQSEQQIGSGRVSKQVKYLASALQPLPQTFIYRQF